MKCGELHRAIRRVLAGLAYACTLCLFGACSSNGIEGESSISEVSDGWFERSTFTCADQKDQIIIDWAGMYRDYTGVEDLRRLHRGSALVQLFRFTWERSFGESFVVTLSIDREGLGTLDVLGWETSPLGVSEEGRFPKPSRMNSKNLTSSQVDDFKALADTVGYWNEANFDCGLGHDGEVWVIESVSDGTYHLVSRWSPRKGAVRQLGEMFIDLSGLGIDPVY